MQFLVKIVKTVNQEAFSGPTRISKMELFAEKVNGFQPFVIFVKSFILDVLNTFWILNTVLNTSPEVLTTFAGSFILDVWLSFRYVSDIKYYFRLGETQNQIIQSDGCYEVLSRKAALVILYFLKYMLEISYRNKDKITAKYLKRGHFKNVETKTKKWFLRNFWEKLF